MNDTKLRKLARDVYKNGKIDPKLAKMIIGNLSRKNLSVFSRILKKMVSENTVRVISQKPLGTSFRSQVKNRFPEKNLIFEQNQAIGTGIKFIVNDTIIDLSLSNFLDSAIENLKN